MTNSEKQFSNPFSSGGGGTIFEIHVQASFVVLMLAGGFVPCFPGCPIKKIKLQGKCSGYDTDDLIIFVEGPSDGQEKRLLAQIKHSITITKGNSVFGDVIQAAWNDFNSPEIFTRGEDSIALITGPLSNTDIKDTRTILEWARSCETFEEFFRNVELTNYSSQAKRDKLRAFRSQLSKCNGDQDVPNEEFSQFLRHFHLLGYDLDIKAGVTLSLLHSLIGQFSPSDVQNIWSRVVEEVQFFNQNAGTITKDSLPHDIQESFKKRVYETIPTRLSRTMVPTERHDWNLSQYASELAIANLVGSWNENSDADKSIVSKLAKENFDKWIPKVQDILHQSGSPVSLKNGVWIVTERKDLWETLGQRLFDSHLDAFKQCAVDVLTERDPQFELQPEERYAASIQGKVLKHSRNLRKGLAESLALLGSNPTALSKCSTGKPETIAILSVRDIFNNSDWVLWGSLNNLLPLLAEASPNEFLSAIEAALQQNPCPFDKLFAQEGKGTFGDNYLTGLLWALETLAWDEEYLVRVSVILGELTTHDPGGRWANRPSNSLTTIFLPWFPQTMAPIEKRKVAIQTLQRENPKAAWKLLLSLLPNPLQNTSGSNKPKWRMSIPEDWPKEIDQTEYWGQVTSYADMTVDMAEHDVTRLEELTDHLDDLSPESLEKILKYLSSEDITGKPENERMPLWTGLTELVSKHEQFADAKWALNSELVSRIKETADKLAPQNRLNLYRRLFIEQDVNLFEEKGNWTEQGKKLEERRILAVKEILGNEGSEAVLNFADMVESPLKVGLSLGFIDNFSLDSIVLPNLLEAESKNLVQLACGLVSGRYYSQGWGWVDRLDMTAWSHSQIGQFLNSLPFTTDTWKRAKNLLGEFESVYWSKVSVNPYQADFEPYLAIDKLLEYGRPNAAIQCLYRILHDKQPLDKTRTVKALLSAVTSKEPLSSIDTHYTIEIIKALQDDPSTNPDDLFYIEWAYLPLLDGHMGASPKTLENKLASDYRFFCEIIRLIYRSRKEPKSEKKHTEQEKAMAQNAYRLLHEWRTPPGMQPDGTFSKEQLTQWLEYTKTACEESGHMEVALTHIGHVLFHCPPDPDGLWINRAVAEVLNAKDAEGIRNGFSTEIFNSRGVHWVDPSGKPETGLSEKYKKQAEEVEDSGYQRLAVTMRSLADFYDKEAKRIIDENRQEDDDSK